MQVAYVEGILEERKTSVAIERHAQLFRNGRNQALRIPPEFELPGDEAIVRQDGNRLIVEPTSRPMLLDLLRGWEPFETENQIREESSET
jgi:antitoxin VapB